MFSGGIERDQWHEMGGFFYESGQTVEISIKYDSGCFIQVLFQDLESFTLPDVAEIGLTFMIFFQLHLYDSFFAVSITIENFAENALRKYFHILYSSKTLGNQAVQFNAFVLLCIDSFPLNLPF